MGLLRSYGAELTGGRQREALVVLGAERANGRRALKCVMAQGDVDVLYEVVELLFHLYEIRGWMQDGFDLFSQLVRALTRAPRSRKQAITRAMAVGCRGWFSNRLGNLKAAQRDIRHSLTVFNELDEPARTAVALYDLGVLTYQLGDYVQAEKLVRQSLELYRATGEAFGAARALSILGIIARDQGLLDEAKTLLEESLALHRALEEKRGISRCLTCWRSCTRSGRAGAGPPADGREPADVTRDRRHQRRRLRAEPARVVHHEMGDYIVARDYARDSLKSGRRSGTGAARRSRTTIWAAR